MTDPRRPDDTEEFEAADEAAGATSEEIEEDEELEADDDFEADDNLDAEEDDLDADELETKELPRAAVTPPAGAKTGAKPAASRGKQASATSAAPVDELPYVDDRVSKIWVVLIAAVFAAIFIYGLLLGRGGILTTSPLPEPTASGAPTTSPSTVVSPTVRPTITVRPSGTALPSAPASPSRAPSPSAPASAVPEPT